MYETFFGLSQAPFSISPDPRYLYLSERHREALAHLLYSLGGPGGFVLLTGDIGTGKTTVCRAFLQQVPSHCRVAYIFNPRLSAVELLQSICEEFRIPLPATGAVSPSIKDFIDPLNRFLLMTHASGGQCVLVIDEAQNLSAEVLEQLRLLTNLETSERKLLQIILIGQPELRDLLARPELEQLDQRVVARFHLDPLNEGETARYLVHRLGVAGRHGPLPLDRAALRRLYALTGGVPRRINLLADRALLGAYARGSSIVGKPIVERAATEVFDDRRAAPAGRRGKDETGVARHLHWWYAAGAAGLVMLALLSVGWWWTRSEAEAVSVSRREQTVQTGDLSAMARLRAESASASPAAGPAPEGASAASPAVAARALAVPGMASSASVQATLATRYDGELSKLARFDPTRDFAELHLDQQGAWRELAAYWLQPVPAGNPCEVLVERDLACYQDGGGTLAALAQMDRPVLLKLVIGGQAARAVLLGLNAHTARIGAKGRQWLVSSAVLKDIWRGEYATLWHPPEGYRRPLRPGDTGPAAQALATALARQVPGPDPQAGIEYDPVTRERLEEFQRRNGLTLSTSVGPPTFMLLHRLNGLPEPRLALE